MTKTHLKVGEIVQLSPVATKNKAFSGCLMIVTEPKAFGAQGFIQGLGENCNSMGGQAYYRANWEEMEQTGGMAYWLPKHYVTQG